MFDGVNFSCIHDRLIVWACHADIKGGDDLIAHAVLAGNIDTGKQLQMINSKAGDFIHEKIPPKSKMPKFF